MAPRSECLPRLLLLLECCMSPQLQLSLPMLDAGCPLPKRRERPAVAASLTARVGSIGALAHACAGCTPCSARAHFAALPTAHMPRPTTRSHRPPILPPAHAGDNRLGGWYSYRASKAAANQLNKCAALEFQRRKQAIAAIVLHPGTVDTGLSQPFQRVSWIMRRGAWVCCRRVRWRAAAHGCHPSQRHACFVCRHPPTLPGLRRQNVPPEKLFTRERAVQQLLAIIDRTSMAETGRFFDWKGDEVEW